jgi:nucleoid DNA-binding protein
LYQGELFAAVARKTGYREEDVRTIGKALWEEILRRVKREDIRTDIGTFYLARLSARRGFNVNTRKMYRVPASRLLRLRAGDTVRAALRGRRKK